MPAKENYSSRQGVEFYILHYDFEEITAFRTYISTLCPKRVKDYELLYRGNGGTTFYLLCDGRIAEDGQTYAQIHSTYAYFSYYMSRAWGNGKVQNWPKRLIKNTILFKGSIEIYSIIDTVGEVLALGSKIEFGEGHLILDTIHKIPTGGYLFKKDNTYYATSSSDFNVINDFILG